MFEGDSEWNGTMPSYSSMPDMKNILIHLDKLTLLT